MTIETTIELRKVFHEAAMQMEVQTFTHAQDWADATEIKQRHESNRAEFERKYREEYDTRVEVVRKRLIDEAGEFNFDHPSPSGNDGFNGDAINRQANREVQNDHERVLQQSRETEASEMAVLRESTRHRNLPHGKAREAFAMVNDQRKGPDRRR